MNEFSWATEPQGPRYCYGGILPQIILVIPNIETLPYTFTYRNLTFCRVPMNSLLGFVIRTYKKVGFGSFRYYKGTLEPLGVAASLGKSFLRLSSCCGLGTSDP